MRLIVSLLFFLFALPTASTAQELHVGAVLHLTGDLAMQSNAFREGIELAVEEVNARGPLKISLTVEDGQNSAKSSHTAAAKLARDGIQFAILSSFLDVMSSGAYLEQKGIPSICIWDSSPEIDAAGKMIFAIGPWIPSGGTVSAEFALKELHAKTAFIIRSTDSWSQSVGDVFKSAFETGGGTILDDVTLGPNETDFRTLISKARGRAPDVLYTPVVFNIVPFYTQLRQLGYKGHVVGSDVIAEEHISKAPAFFEGIYQSGLLNPTSRKYRELETSYTKQYGHAPTLPWYVAVAYDSVLLIEAAAKKGGVTPAGLSSGMYQVQAMEGASTTLSINPEGSSPQLEVMYQVKNGKLQPR